MKSKWFIMSASKLTKRFHSNPDKAPKDVHEAYEKSYEKWTLIGKGYKADDTIEECGFCNVFRYHPENTGLKDCHGCPISEFTGHQYCIDTVVEDYLETDNVNVRPSVTKVKAFLTKVYRQYLSERAA